MSLSKLKSKVISVTSENQKWTHNRKYVEGYKIISSIMNISILRFTLSQDSSDMMSSHTHEQAEERRMSSKNHFYRLLLNSAKQSSHALLAWKVDYLIFAKTPYFHFYELWYSFCFIIGAYHACHLCWHADFMTKRLIWNNWIKVNSMY